MSALPADLAPDRLDAALADAPLGRSREVCAETASTMDLAWAARERGAPHGHLALADRQSAGRGTHGRRWDSPGGLDLYLSVLLRPGAPAAALATLPLAVGAAVAQVAEDAGVNDARVKWPNDVVVGAGQAARKLSGTLVESRAPAGGGAPDVVVGIGLNVRRARFPTFGEGDLPGTSLSLEGARTTERPVLLAAVLRALAERLERLLAAGSEAVLPEVARRLWGRDQPVVVQAEGDAPLRGVLRGLAADGGLRLEVAGAERVVRSGRLGPA
ncbi:MAG: biotin--[acetyl-CoA-carboxylase] ligase [Myxococcota bacterium]